MSNKLICERCKLEFTIEDKPFDFLTGIFCKNSNGFKTIENTRLCKSCYRHFNIVFDKFMEKKL